MAIAAAHKLIGGNIVPTVAEVDIGAAGWKQLHVDWDDGGWDWVERQVDTAVGQCGVNCIRMIGDYIGVHDGTFTQATYNSHWVQLLDKCAAFSPKVYVYVCCGDQNQISGISNSALIANASSLLEALAAYDNVPAADLISEMNANGSASIANAVYTGVKSNTSLSLTLSNTQKVTDNDGSGWQASITVDHYDFHLYKMNGYGDVPLVASDLNAWQGKPIILGEFGSPKSDTKDQNASFINSLWQLIKRDARLAGGCLWALQDQSVSSSSEYGLADADWNLNYVFRSGIRQVTGGSLASAN